MKMRKYFGIVFVLLLSVLFCGFTKDDVRVYDQGEFLSDSEEVQLEELIDKVSEEIQMDLVVVTTVDTEGKEAWQYAEWFYYDAGYTFGYEQTDKGVLYLIDMDNREIYVYCSEGAAAEISNKDIDQILDVIFDQAADGRYYISADSFVRKVRSLVEEGDTTESSSPEIEETEEEEGNPVMVGMLISLVTVIILVKKQKTSVKVPHTSYLNSSKTRMYRKEDHFIRTTVVTRKIETPSSSGSSSRSSGRSTSGSHSRGSGGGRKL